MTLGEKIKIARKQAGLSQEQLAEKMSVSRAAVAKWEVNNGMPDIDNLKTLAHLLGVTIDCLVDDGENLDEITMEEAIDISKDTESRRNVDHADEGEKLDNVTTKDMKTYAVISKISSLCVNINAADITIKQGEVFSVESNLKYLTVKNENSLLSIRNTKKPFWNCNNATLVITIPTDVVLENAEIKTGAGKLTVDTLSVKVLKCDFGAVEVNIDSLSASSAAKIDGGAGKITISCGSINNLDFDMGVGQLNLTSLLTGDCDLALGVGKSNITLLGSKSDYTLDITKSIGSICVDGDNISYTSGHGSGQNKINLRGGIGAVNVKFRQIDENDTEVKER